MRPISRARLLNWLHRSTRRTRDWSTLDCGTDGILAFSPPDYLGVTESTKRFFEHWYPLDSTDLTLPGDRRRFLDGVAAAGPTAVVFSGFDEGYEPVLRSLRRRHPTIPIYALWHSSFAQLIEECSRRYFETLLSLQRERIVTRIGCFDTGMGRILSRLGVDAVDVFNLPPSDPGRDRPAIDPPGGGPIRIGLFSAGPSWRKNPYVMLAAVGDLQQSAKTSITGVLDDPSRLWADSMGLNADRVSPTPLNRTELKRLASGQHCNLYVSLSECSPLFPIESLHWGVPCLIGPGSHLFSRSPVLPAPSGATRAEIERGATRLERLLVVERPDDPASIAASIPRAIEARDEILAAYADWEPAYRLAARSSMESLLETPCTPPESP